VQAGRSPPASRPSGRKAPRHGRVASRPHCSGLETKEMSNKPTHTAYVVIDPREGSDRKAQWIEVGAVWPHKSGKGFDLVIPDGISLSGRIVCRERKEQPAE
jgi:hypothetical protein